MFLSKLVLNLRNPKARHDLARPYEMHCTLSQAFPEKAMGRVLFRAEPNRLPADPVVLVQSELAPDWRRVQEKFPGFFIESPSKPFHPLFTNGQRLRFRLRANPTKKIGTASIEDRRAGKRCNGRRVAILKEEEQIAWLAERGKVHEVTHKKGKELAVFAGGFRLLQVKPFPDRDQQVYGCDQQPQGWVRDRKKEKDTGKVHDLTFFAVLFEGVLEITDAQAFLTSVAFGVGPAKGLGFGLLSVAPLEAQP